MEILPNCQNVTKCLIQRMSPNVTKCNKMKTPNVWNATDYYKMSHNVDALFKKCYGMQKQKQRNVTKLFKT